MRPALLALLLAAVFAAAAVAAPSHEAACSAAHLSPKLPDQRLPAAVADTRRRIAAAAVACDFARLERIGREQGGFSFSFGGERSAATVWRAAERQGARPMAVLVKILGLPVTRNEAGAYAWPTAYREHPSKADWDALVRAGVLTRAQADRQRTSGNVYYGYRTAITRSGDWLFFVAGD